MRPKLALLPVVLAACTILAACGSSGANSAGAASSAASSSSAGDKTAPASITNTQAESRDNTDPGSDCGTNGSLNNPNVVTLGPAVMVRLPNGQPWGSLKIRHSTICQAAWGEVFFTPPKPAGYSKVTIVLTRSGGPHPKALPPFYTNDYRSPVFSSMLGNNTDDGCVQATAWVTVKGVDGPKAKTHCEAG